MKDLIKSIISRKILERMGIKDIPPPADIVDYLKRLVARRRTISHPWKYASSQTDALKIQLTERNCIVEIYCVKNRLSISIENHNDTLRYEASCNLEEDQAVEFYRCLLRDSTKLWGPLVEFKEPNWEIVVIDDRQTLKIMLLFDVPGSSEAITVDIVLNSTQRALMLSEIRKLTNGK